MTAPAAGRGPATAPNTMPFTIAAFERALASSLEGLPPAPAAHPRFCVALSGGLDSTVLLAALAELARMRGFLQDVRAVHVDHGLHADAAQWSRASAEAAARAGVRCEVVRVDARGARGESPEAAAREARQAAFRRCLAPGEVLLTAHHADDQLETVLLQWLRGGGLRAVAGMAALAPLGDQAWHARPLLGFSRGELESFAHERSLPWIADPSNDDPRFDRNYLRHAVLPRVRQRWPGAARNVARVAGFARDALELEAAVAAQDLAATRRGAALELAALLRLPEARQRAVLRAWLAALGLPPPAAATLAALRRDAGAAAADRNPRTAWPGAVVHRYRGYLHAVPPHACAPLVEGRWHTGEASVYACGTQARLELEAATGEGLSRARLPAIVQVRRRAGGERFVPAGGAHRRDLRKWLQERAVLPWRREQLPLLVDDDGRLVAVADLGCGAHFAARPGEPSWRVRWHGRGLVTEHDAFGFRWPADPPIG